MGHIYNALEDVFDIDTTVVLTTLDTRYLKLDCSNSPLTSSLGIGGSLTINTDGNKLLLGTGSDGEIYVNSDNLYIFNITQDKDILLGINDGGVTKTITWDASADVLLHSAGTFNFDNDNIITTGDITGANLITVGNLSNGSDTLTIANAKTAYDHSQDNTQAHSDYLLNNDNDSTSGTITAAGFILSSAGIVKGETKCFDVSIINPNGAYGVDTQIPIGVTPAALTVTKVQVSLNTAAQEVAGDVKWADDLLTYGNAAVINDFDTTSGVRVDTSITAGAVAAGKFIYLQFDSEPNVAITFMLLHIEYDVD